MSWKVRWSRVALRDPEEIIRYIARDSPTNARRVQERILQRAATLEENARRGRIVPELADFGIRRWRELILEPYRLGYQIVDDTVRVDFVFDGRRDAEALLQDRLLRSP